MIEFSNLISKILFVSITFAIMVTHFNVAMWINPMKH